MPARCFPARARTAVAHVLDNVQTHPSSIAPLALLHHRRRCSDNHSRPIWMSEQRRRVGQHDGAMVANGWACVCCFPARARTAVAHVLDNVQTHQGPVAEHRAAASSRPVRTTIVGRLWMSEQRRRVGQQRSSPTLLDACTLFSSTSANGGGARAGKQRAGIPAALPTIVLRHRLALFGQP